MKCNCLDKIKKAHIDGGTYKGKKITDVSFPIGFTKELESVLMIPLDATVEGMKKPVKHQIGAVYCPFCGVKQIVSKEAKG